MKQRISHPLAAMVAAGAASLALAQPSPTSPAPQPSFVAEPVASLTTTSATAPDQRLADLVQALNADASLKNAKITVQLDGDSVVLTGAAMTQEQARRAAEIAASTAEGPVVNAIQADHIESQRPAQSAG